MCGVQFRSYIVYMQIVSFFYLLYLVNETLKGILKGMGDVHASVVETDPCLRYDYVVFCLHELCMVHGG